jgi:hypothetical protein
MTREASAPFSAGSSEICPYQSEPVDRLPKRLKNV